MKKRSVEQAFSEAAPDYDTWVRQALPAYDELFSVAVECIPFAHDRPLAIADLGAGSGLFSRHVQSAYPQAAFTRLEDFAEPERFDVVISSLAIHHLEDADKRSLFKRIFTALRPGGAFLNVDQIKGHPPFDRLYWETWLARVRAAGASEDKIQTSIKRRRDFDHDASLSDQLKWLKEAGFAVDCIYKHYFVAVLLALKNDS